MKDASGRRGRTISHTRSRHRRLGRRLFSSLAACLLCVAITVGCSKTSSDDTVPDAGIEALGGLKIDNPLNGAVFPPELPPPTFRWTEHVKGVTQWRVIVRLDKDDACDPVLVRSADWTPDAELWESIKEDSVEHPANVIVEGLATGEEPSVLSRAGVVFSTSKDRVDAPLFYREVNLPFAEAVKDPTNIRWRFGSVSSVEQPPVVLERLPVCGNCHSFSRNGDLLGMDVDYANDKGSYAIAPIEKEIGLSPGKIISWSDYRKDDGQNTFGLLSQISPDGKYVISTVKDQSVFVPKDDLAFSQLFFPVKGILAVYSRETGEFAALPGANEPKYVQSNPTWSPDGKYVVFARSKARPIQRIGDARNVLLTAVECKPFLEDGEQFLFDLYRVPFNGGRGGKAEPIRGASQNGMSNFFAKYSPDGRWIVFCKSKSFMLLQPDSELYIIPAEGGEARRLACNTSRMNSWHTYSPNGRWLAFSSKAFSPYTQLFVAHIDEEGRASPPVLLSRFTSADRAANIPEFVNTTPTAIAAIREQFVDDVSYVRAGDAFRRADDLPGAIAEYRKAIQANPDNVDAHCNLGGLLAITARPDEAAEQLNIALRLRPDLASAHYNLGMLRFRQDRYDESMTHFAAALRSNPDLADAHSMLGTLLCAKGRIDEGKQQYAAALRLDPRNPPAHYGLGELAIRQGQADLAAEHFARVVETQPDHAAAHYGLGKILFARGAVQEGIGHLSVAAEQSPNDPRLLQDLAWVLVMTPEPTLRDSSRAVQLAKRACELTRNQDPGSLDLLGVCYAENGEFTEAIQAAGKALELAVAAENEPIAGMIRQRIESYKKGQPYRVSNVR